MCRRNVIIQTGAMLIGAAWLFAAEAPPRGKPAPSNIPGRDFPRIQDDLSVTFPLKAPDATKVQLAPRGNDSGLGSGPFDMKRDAAVVQVTGTLKELAAEAASPHF